MSLIQALAASTSATQTSALGIENPAMQQFTSIQDMLQPYGWSWPWEDDEEVVDTTTPADTATTDTPTDTTPTESEITEEPVADGASDSNTPSSTDVKETTDESGVANTATGSDDTAPAETQAEDESSSKDEQPVDDSSTPTDSTPDSSTSADSGSTDEGSAEQQEEEKGDGDDGDRSDAKDPSWRPRNGDDFRTPTLDQNDDDDDDDGRRVPIDNNGPRDSFNSLVEDCGWQCQLTFSLQMIYFGVHLWLYAGELHAWAEANLILIFGTIWFLFMSVWTCAVGFMHPDFLAYPLWTRLAPFVLSVMYMAYYVTGIIFEMVKVFSTGETWKDSVHEIIIAYMLWINIPSALTMTTYIILEMVNTEDIIESSEKENDDIDDQSDDEDGDDKDGAYYDKYDDSRKDDDKADDKADDDKDEPKPVEEPEVKPEDEPEVKPEDNSDVKPEEKSEN